MDSGGSKEVCIRWDPDPLTGRAILRGFRLDFPAYRRAPFPWPLCSYQRSDWPAAEAVELNFLNEKFPCIAASRRNSLTTCYCHTGIAMGVSVCLLVCLSVRSFI